MDEAIDAATNRTGKVIDNEELPAEDRAAKLKGEKKQTKSDQRDA